LSFVSTSYTGLFFVTLEDWKDRTSTRYSSAVDSAIRAIYFRFLRAA